MKYRKTVTVLLLASAIFGLIQCNNDNSKHPDKSDSEVINDGKKIFRFDTFDDEYFRI